MIDKIIGILNIANIKVACQIMLITSMVGLGIINLIGHQLKEFGLGFLYAIANTIIFIL